jgi:hypothetical protein
VLPKYAEINDTSFDVLTRLEVVNEFSFNLPTVPVNTVNGVGGDVMVNINGKESLWIDFKSSIGPIQNRGWRTGDMDKDSGLSGMKLLENSQMNSAQGTYTDCGTDYAEVDPRNMSSFYNCRKSPDNPTPYATTMLINSMPTEMCTNPAHSHSEHEIGAGGSSGTSSLHSDGKFCMHSKHFIPGECRRGGGVLTIIDCDQLFM